MANSGIHPNGENWDLLGNEWAVHMLQQHILRHAVRHAYLFTGPSGLGKRTLALRFSQALNCPSPTAPGLPCGTCRDCRQITLGQHPDLSIVQAESEGGTLKIEQVREVRRTLTLKPYQAPYRVAIFLRFQEANQNASNALLKTLEEAPSYAVLILTADNSDQLLPTITSRCEILRLRPLDVPAIENHLIELGAGAEQAEFISHLSNGRPGYALRLLEDMATLEARADRLGDLHTLLGSTRVAKFKYAEALAKDRGATQQTLLIWLSYWRDVLLTVTGASAPLTNTDLSDKIDSVSSRLPLTEVRRVISGLEKALDQLESNINPRLLLEVLLLDLPEVKNIA